MKKRRRFSSQHLKKSSVFLSGKKKLKKSLIILSTIFLIFLKLRLAINQILARVARVAGFRLES